MKFISKAQKKCTDWDFRTLGAVISRTRRRRRTPADVTDDDVIIHAVSDVIGDVRCWCSVSAVRDEERARHAPDDDDELQSVYSGAWQMSPDRLQCFNKKSELMLIKRATACSSFYSQDVLVRLHLFLRNLLLQCALEPKITKTFTETFIKSSRSFNVIDVNKPKKLVSRHQCLLW